MVASANWVPVPVTRKARGFVRPSYSYKDKTVDSDATMHQQQQQQANAHRHQQQPPAVLLRIDDSDEELEPFDAESFVDRLVEDDPPPWRMGGGVVGEGARLWEAPEIFSAANKTPTDDAKNNGETVSSSSTTAAKLFLQPIYSWPPPPPPPSGVDGQGSQDMPMIVPHDPILDALFTPARTSPEIVPTVTMGLVRVASAGSGGRGGTGITRFQPAAIYNIPPLAEQFSAVPLVPMAPSRRHFDCHLYEQHAPRAGVTSGILVESAKKASSAKLTINSNINCINSKSGGAFSTTYHQESSKNVLSIAGSAFAFASGTTSSTACLTGADAYSSEYDDDQHAFLRQQELALFVGPAYLAGPGRLGLVTPAARTAIVDWLTGIHAAAPAASGGGAPLSLETLFLAVNLLDRFLSTAVGARTAYAGGAMLKVAAAACLALGSKYEDTQPTSLWGVAVAATNEAEVGVSGNDGGGGDYFGGDSCEGAGVGEGIGGGAGGNSSVDGGYGADGVDVGAARKEVAAMELRVASALGFRLTVPTALSFLGVFLRRAGALGYLPEGHVSERVREEAQQILQCVLRDASSLEHPPSAIAASALYWASCVTTPGAAAPESFAFFAVTGYQLERLCRCLRDMEGVRTGGGERYASHAAGGDRAAVTFAEHATLFGVGGGHPTITAL